ncbi:Hyoscyamine 6-dioxygenase [Sesamum angolense]|uniref:Hyoscyamine 6-dioxygenase n=1 Tax=Sesamum angolense TaxID=2727404 RepID=A0AAE2C3X6_9LAMI|nr:Hyoscyamine 6-dioxygenase [Sesamum angolense]
MEVLMSNWSNVVQSLPEKYVFPPEKRPGKDVFPVVNDVPVIDLETAEGHGRGEIVHQILHACQQFGFFQVINHGVPISLMDDTMNVLKEFFGKLLVRIQLKWVRSYCLDFGCISEGLGLKLGYFDGELSKIQLLSVNHHIPCPNPSLTLGMPEHCDPNLISMLQQCPIPGLQVFHQGQWMNVDPMPNAFVVIPGLQLKVISNGKFSSPIHRVMTHPKEGRTTMGTFLIPSHGMLIHPPHHDPLYRAFTYQEFFTTFTKNNCDADFALEYFKNKT